MMMMNNIEVAETIFQQIVDMPLLHYA